MKTLEEAAREYWKRGQFGLEKAADTERAFLKGAKWQQEKMYSDMQEYAEFCIECDRKQMPLLLVQDWYEHYKKEIV